MAYATVACTGITQDWRAPPCMSRVHLRALTCPLNSGRAQDRGRQCVGFAGSGVTAYNPPSCREHLATWMDRSDDTFCPSACGAGRPQRGCGRTELLRSTTPAE